MQCVRERQKQSDLRSDPPARLASVMFTRTENGRLDHGVVDRERGCCGIPNGIEGQGISQSPALPVW